MKYFTALVNATLADGTHHFTHIEFLIKRHRSNKKDAWTYTVKIGYAEQLDDPRNKPLQFVINGDWEEALHHAFNKELGWMKNVKMEFLTEVKI